MKEKNFIKLNNTIIYIIAGITLFVVFTTVLIFENVFCKNYSCLVFPEKKDWETKEIYENTSKTWWGLLLHNDILMRLRVYSDINQEDADYLTKVEVMKINGIFNQWRSPYPGAVSDTIECQEEFKPTTEKIISDYGIKVTYITTNLNDRLQYGVCTENQISKRVALGIFYCPNVKQWFSLELITDKNDLNSQNSGKEFFQKIGCQLPLFSKIDKLTP